jgi:hypothetical protein
MSTVTPREAELIGAIIAAGSIKGGAYDAGVALKTAETQLRSARNALKQRTTLSLLIAWDRLTRSGQPLPIRYPGSVVQAAIERLTRRAEGASAVEVAAAADKFIHNVQVRLNALARSGRLRKVDGEQTRFYWNDDGHEEQPRNV